MQPEQPRGFSRPCNSPTDGSVNCSISTGLLLRTVCDWRIPLLQDGLATADGTRHCPPVRGYSRCLASCRASSYARFTTINLTIRVPGNLFFGLRLKCVGLTHVLSNWAALVSRKALKADPCQILIWLTLYLTSFISASLHANHVVLDSAATSVVKKRPLCGSWCCLISLIFSWILFKIILLMLLHSRNSLHWPVT